MLKLFQSTDRSFGSNGDKVIKAFRAKVHKADNEDFYLEIETDLSYVDDIVEGNIIVAPTPQGEQPFRIRNVTKTKNKITTRAYHVFYDSQNYLISDSYVVDMDCNDALDHLNAATDITSPFTMISDIEVIDSFRCVRQSLFEAIYVVLERWGGHLVRDGYTIGVRSSIGQDNGVTVRYKKNLKDITCEENWDEVCTKILPVGKDGITLPEAYLTGSTSYDIPYTKTISFSQDDIEEDSYEDPEDYEAALIEDLRQQATAYLIDHALPEVSYNLKANLEKITDVGDTVEVIDERLGINILTNVISYEYDCILGKYTDIEFGNFKKTISGLMDTITAQTEEIVNEKTEVVKVTLSDEMREATDRIWGALGNSYVIYEGDKILVVDNLPKETAINVIMINNGGIAFSQTGINGTFNSAWTIDGTMNMQNINVINLTADLIKGGILKLGSNLDEHGTIEVYADDNSLICDITAEGIKTYGKDGSYVIMNQEEGFAGYDADNNKIFWVDYDMFHMKKAVIEEEISLCKRLKFLPITITNNGTVVNDGIGLVSAFRGEE